jgi:hypothetical protein
MRYKLCGYSVEYEKVVRVPAALPQLHRSNEIERLPSMMKFNHGSWYRWQDSNRLPHEYKNLSNCRRKLLAEKH